jgi:thiamine-phosphate pyrophosphorylase
VTLLLCFVTDRKNTPEPLAARAGRILSAGARFVMLREKDLSGEGLAELAKGLIAEAEKRGAGFVLNGGVEEARAAGAKALQLSFAKFLEIGGRLGEFGDLEIGVSVHGEEEAAKAAAAGAKRLLAGHVFGTECKPGLPGRGPELLGKLRRLTGLPVWAVGGITPENAKEAIKAGAEAVCVMSRLSRCPDPEGEVGAYLAALAKE